MDTSRSRACAHIEANILIDQARAEVDGSEHDVFDLIKWRLGEFLFANDAYSTHYADEVITRMASEIEYPDEPRRKKPPAPDDATG